jgi:hypothetical protein
LDEVLQIRNVPGDAERFAAAPALERLKDAKRICKSTRDWRHVPRTARAAVQDDHKGSCSAIRANSNLLHWHIAPVLGAARTRAPLDAL